MSLAARPWRLRRLLGAPHRLGFALGGAAMGLLALWWLAMLAAPRLGLAPRWVLPPTLAHGLLFTLGFMPAFMAGFLFTAGPRWLGRPAVEARQLLPALLQFGLGWVFVLAGAHASALLAAFGLAMAASAWLRLSLRFAAMLRASRTADRLHVRWLLAACAVGVGSLLLACLALVRGDAGLLHAAIQLGLWGFVAPVHVVVSHRMLPFFGAVALPRLQVPRPFELLLPLGSLALAGLAEMAWLPPGLLAAPLALASLALLGAALRWRQAHGLKGESRRLLAMLHGGWVWLGLALGLQALSLALQSRGGAGLGAVPLHALTLGYLGSTLIAMATRVAAGHSGRPLAVDRAGWALYRLLQLGVLLRLAAGLGLQAGLLPAAAIWAVVAAAWAWRQAGWLGRPRIDGRPD